MIRKTTTSRMTAGIVMNLHKDFHHREHGEIPGIGLNHRGHREHREKPGSGVLSEETRALLAEYAERASQP